MIVYTLQITLWPASCGLLDVVFVMDSSGSINYNYYLNWNYALTFVSNLASLLPTPNTIRFGMVVFSDNAQNSFFLNTYSSSTTQALYSFIYSRKQSLQIIILF